MAVFFIDTSSGRVATKRQLADAGLGDHRKDPPRPWLKIQGSNDATTMWYAVMRRQERGIFIGSLAFRHNDHHASLLAKGWEEVPIAEFGAGLAEPAA
jgi:hypothetical protein